MKRPGAFFAFDGMHLIHNIAVAFAEKIAIFKSSIETATEVKTEFSHKITSEK